LKAVDAVIINPSSRLTATPNKRKYNKVKSYLNRNSQSQTGSSDLVHVPRNDISKVLHQDIRGIMDSTNELMNSLVPEFPNILRTYKGTSPKGT
jgi:hypothetical protein